MKVGKALKALPVLLGATILSAVLASQALAVPAAPAWSIQSLATPTNFIPGDESGEVNYQIQITNSGGKVTDQSPITVTGTLPAGLEVSGVKLFALRSVKEPVCNTTEPSPEVRRVSCEVTDALNPQTEPSRFAPGNSMALQIFVKVPPSVTGGLVNRVEVEGGGAEPALAEAENQASAEDPPAGFEEFHASATGADGKPANSSDSYPYQYTTSFGVNLVPTPPGSAVPFLPAEGDLKDIEVALPPGLAGNPTAVNRCDAQRFTDHHATFSTIKNSSITSNNCPIDSVVGVAIVQQLEGRIALATSVPIYNLVPPKGMPAQLGFEVQSAPNYINTKLRSDGDYGITGYVHSVTEAKRVTALRVTIWGTPWDQSHDPMRGECTESWAEACPLEEGAGTPRPFLRMPSSCTNPLTTTMSFTTWARPVTGASESDTEAPPVGCSQPPFTPTIDTTPSTNVADSPSGLHVDVHLPQKENEDPQGLGEADLRDATVTLPPGLTVNPSSANGLGACSLSQIGYQGMKEGKPSFSTEPANCPDASKIGTVEVVAPAVDHPLQGSIYLATQSENPCGSILALYIAVHDPQTGVVIKLAGRVDTNPLTGQITNVFEQNPQIPFEDLKVDLFEGARAPLRTPQICGESATTPSFTTTTSLVPWTAPEGLTAHPTDSFAMAQSPGGGPCAPSEAALPNSPSFEAGTANPLAGAYSPFVLRLKREDGSQELKGLNVTLPSGLVAKLAGTTECSPAGVAQAQSRSNPGQGALEKESPSCPASSQLGTVTVGAGAGPSPFYAEGKAYLAGPYKGAPLSMLIVTPAVAGPFDLGSVAVRAALNVDPETAKVSVVSDPIPTIVQGIPLDVRSIAVRVDRPNFTLNPTSCEVKSLTAEAISVTGQAASLNNRFQVGGCSSLRFKPSVSLKLSGGTKRSAHPALRAVVSYPQGSNYANTAKASVALPHSEFLEQSHIRTICTRVQFAANACPSGSIYGKAKAITPLLDKPLEGPVYLRSSSNPLPDLVLSLHGQLDVVAVGRVDSINGGIRGRFEAVPDAPLSKVILEMQGGKKGLFVNSRNICKHTNRATARFTAQNGKTYDFRPVLKDSCKGKKPRKDKRGR